jgi:hypothetical protein
MSGLTFDATYPEQRNRLTVAFRFIVAIPHLIVSQVWGYLAQIVAIGQWFIILFTGKRNDGIFQIQTGWLEYYARVFGYTSLLHDVFPPFGPDSGGTVAITTTITNDEPVNRLTNALRFIWVIPAAFIAGVLMFAAFFVEVISWFAILLTGTQPRGMWDFTHKVVRYVLQTQAYGLLMTDTYPKYG